MREYGFDESEGPFSEGDSRGVSRSDDDSAREDDEKSVGVDERLKEDVDDELWSRTKG